MAGFALTLVVTLVVTLSVRGGAHTSGGGPVEVAVPPVPPPTGTDDCARASGSWGSCAEWFRPQPRSFPQVLALDAQPVKPPEMDTWSALYLCGHPPDELSARLLGPDFYRVVINGFICTIEGFDAEHSGGSFSVNIGDNAGQGRFEDWADTTSESEIIDFEGRRVIVDRSDTDSEYFSQRSWIMELPGRGDQVLVLDYSFFPPLDATEADNAARAEETMRSFAHVYREMTG